MNIQELKNQLDYHDNLYYNQDSPELSDIEYDAMKAKYLELSGQEEYNYVPGIAQFKKYKHQFSIKSLGKINTIEQVWDELERLKPVVVEPKYDGLTLVVYPDGIIATRGNGTIGEDVTHTASKFVKRTNKYNLPVRGEAYMPISIFNKINKQRELEGKELFKNPRNAIAGVLRNKDNKNVPDGLHFVAYDIVNSPLSHMQQLIQLKNDYEIPDVNYMWTSSELEDAVKFIENFDRSKLDYEIDGLVIKSNKADSLSLFGFTEHHNKNAIAYKFPNQGEWTVLKSITWQTGRTGRITPVAELEPVDILGSTIERATLHNIGYIQTLGLMINSNVKVCKQNDVIPAVVECKHVSSSISIDIPSTCPSCGGGLKTVNDQLFCINANCQAKLLYRTKHMVGRDALNIEGMSEQTVQKMIEAGYITEPWHIFNITEQEISNLDGFAKKSAKKIYDAIQNARNCDFDKAIYASGMDLIGRKVSKDIAKLFGSYDIYINDTERFIRISNINGVGDAITDSLKENEYLLSKLISYLNIRQPEEKEIVNNKTSLEGKIFVVTGDFQNYKPRTKLQELIESLGGKCSGSVSKNTNYLISNDTDSNTGKSQKAKQLGVTIINEIQFEELIRS